MVVICISLVIGEIVPFFVCTFCFFVKCMVKYFAHCSLAFSAFSLLIYRSPSKSLFISL